MKCPYCSSNSSQVKDSRSSEDGAAIRRRRYCPKCDNRFTTYERVTLKEIVVIKRNGQRRNFMRAKIEHAIKIATRKRGVSDEAISMMINEITRDIENLAPNSTSIEISSRAMGQMIMQKLAKLDKVAYIRFASVYKDFSTSQDFTDFMAEIDN